MGAPELACSVMGVFSRELGDSIIGGRRTRRKRVIARGCRSGIAVYVRADREVVMSRLIAFFAVLIVVFINVLFGLDWQAAPLTPMPETKAVTYATPPPAPTLAVTPPPTPIQKETSRMQRRIAMWPYPTTRQRRMPLRLRKPRRNPSATSSPVAARITRSKNRIAPINQATVHAGFARKA